MFKAIHKISARLKLQSARSSISKLLELHKQFAATANGFLQNAIGYSQQDGFVVIFEYILLQLRGHTVDPEVCRSLLTHTSEK